MASVYKNGKRWRASVVMPNGRRITKSFDAQADANSWANDREYEAAHGTWQTSASRRLTFGEYAEKWFEALATKQSTADNYRRHLDRHLLPEFGDTRISAISNTDVQRWATQHRRAGHAHASVFRYVTSMKTILNAAVADQVLAKNPIVRVRIPDPPMRDPRDAELEVMTIEHVVATIAALPAEMRAFGWVGAMAGLRPGETNGLTVDAIDLPGEELHVVRQMATTSTGVGFAQPKTRNSLRTVPIPTELAGHLRRHIDEHPPAVFDGRQLLFHRDGRPYARGTLSEIWRDTRTTTNLPTRFRGWHDLRHFYASLLIADGASVKAVQNALGHASAMETLDTYGHLWPGSSIEIRNSISRAFGGVR